VEISGNKPVLSRNNMEKAPVKCYYPSELANMYGISYKQLFKWLETHREKVHKGKKRILTVTEVEYIFSTFGRPEIKKAP
jgi:uncharacterized protein YjcR